MFLNLISDLENYILSIIDYQFVTDFNSDTMNTELKIIRLIINSDIKSDK